MWGDYTITCQFRSGKNESQGGMVRQVDSLRNAGHMPHERSAHDRNY